MTAKKIFNYSVYEVQYLDLDYQLIYRNEFISKDIKEIKRAFIKLHKGKYEIRDIYKIRKADIYEVKKFYKNNEKLTVI